MNIRPVVFAFEKDDDLVFTQRKLMKKIDAPILEHAIIVDRKFTPSLLYEDFLEHNGIRKIIRPDGYFPWGSWNHCMSKLGGYKQYLEEVNPPDDDYILDMDSDAFLLNGKMLSFLGTSDFVGIQFENRFKWIERFKKRWSHVFGSFMAMRASALRRAVSISEEDLLWARRFFETTPPFEMVNEQFVSLIMEMVGAEGCFPLNHGLFAEGQCVEKIMMEGGKGFSVLHFYGSWNTFAGHKIDSKYDIPRIMRKLKLV